MSRDGVAEGGYGIDRCKFAIDKSRTNGSDVSYQTEVFRGQMGMGRAWIWYGLGRLHRNRSWRNVELAFSRRCSFLLVSRLEPVKAREGQERKGEGQDRPTPGSSEGVSKYVPFYCM